MLNIDDFVKRLETIFDYYGLTASSFADKINVQRSSVSHLLSGRNKPSLDFIMKLIESFPEVDLLWILNGTGNFPKGENQNLNYIPVERKIEKVENTIFSENSDLNLQADLFTSPIDEKNEVEKNRVNENDFKKFSNMEVLEKHQNQPSNYNNLEIEKIVIFYTDGTFSSYKQKNPNSN